MEKKNPQKHYAILYLRMEILNMGEVKRCFQPGFEFSAFVISLKTLIMLQNLNALIQRMNCDF